MPIDLDTLLDTRALRLVPRAALTASAPLWTVRSYAPDRLLWAAGQTPDGIGVLTSGEVTIELNGRVLITLYAGDVIGDASGFLGEGRSPVTVRCIKMARVLAVDREGLRRLRRDHPVVYDALLELALHGHARLLSSSQRCVSSAPAAGKLPPRPAQIGRAPAGQPFPLVEILRELPGLGHAGEPVLRAIAGCFKPQAVSDGETLFTEDQPRTTAWIVADGALFMTRRAQDGGETPLGRLCRGASVGTIAVVVAGNRSATAYATEPTWLWRAQPRALAALTGEALIASRECLLGMFNRELTGANEAGALEPSSQRVAGSWSSRSVEVLVMPG